MMYTHELKEYIEEQKTDEQVANKAFEDWNQAEQAPVGSPEETAPATTKISAIFKKLSLYF